MKALLYPVISSAFLSGCSSSTNSELDNTGSFLCVPTEYAVSVPGSRDSDVGFDPEGGGYGTSILIEGEEVARVVPGFKAEIGAGTNVRYQSLYVMLAPRSEVEREPSVPEPGRTLDESDRLAKVDSDSFGWQVIEQAEEEQAHWGICADRFTQPESYSCLRDLLVADLALTYPIHQQNLHLYREIDSMLAEKINEWRCESGDIPLER